MDNKWTEIPCGRCGGCGLVSEYTFGGTDFLGAGECPDCGGSGAQWMRPSGHLFMHPGGPAIGSMPKCYLPILMGEGSA